MLKRSACHRIVSQPLFDSLLRDVQADFSVDNYALQVDELPPAERIFPSVYGSEPDVYNPYPSRKQHLDLDEVVFYLHSSGSTGFPKPIPQRNRAILSCCKSCEPSIPHWLGSSRYRQLIVFLLPYSHHKCCAQTWDYLGSDGVANVPCYGNLHATVCPPGHGISNWSICPAVPGIACCSNASYSY